MDPRIIGQIIAGAGQAQQDITSYLTPILTHNQQRQALRGATDNINKGYDKATGYQQPYYDQGMRDYQTLGSMNASGAYNMPIDQRYNAPQEGTYGTYNNQPFTFNYQQDPGYQARLQEGTNAIENSAAARGAQLSGATMKALAKYGQNFASNEYANAYNRARGAYENDRNFGYNQFADTRNFNRDQFVNNRNFGYGVYGDTYARNANELTNRFNRQNILAGYGTNAAANLGNLAVDRYTNLANMNLQQGNVDAALWNGVGNASMAQGQGAKDFGNNLTNMFSFGGK